MLTLRILFSYSKYDTKKVSVNEIVIDANMNLMSLIPPAWWRSPIGVMESCELDKDYQIYMICWRLQT